MGSTTRVKSDVEIAEQVLQETQQLYPVRNAAFRVLPVIDKAGGNFLLLDEGWDGHTRIHRVWLHIEVCCGKYYVHEDCTEIGVANLLMAAGVPPERIVLALDPPVMRGAGKFAVA